MKNWKTHRLGELVDVLSGFAFDASLFGDSGDMPVVRIRDVVRGYSSTFYRGEYESRFVLHDGDLLVGMDGEFNCAKWQGGPAVINQRVCKISTTSVNLDDGYLFRFLPAALKKIEDVTPFVTVKHLSVKAIRDIEIPLPPIAEQRRIAEVLDRAEALRAKRRAALAELDALTQSLFLDLFGDPVTNPKGWERAPFFELLSNIDSGWSPVCLDRPVGDGEWGILKLGAITWCEYDPYENKALPQNLDPEPTLEVKKGDLLFARKNTHDLVAACALVHETPPKLMMSDLIFRLRLKPEAPLNTTFLHQLLIYPTKKREIQKLAGGSSGSMPNISKARLMAATVEIPPLALQQEFARRVAAVEKLKQAQRTALAELDALFATLQHRAFRGEL